MIKPEYLALLNLSACMGIFWACICRLNSEHSKTIRTIRARYSLLLGGAVIQGFQPTLFNTWPGVAGTAFSWIVLGFLALSLHRWSKNQ